MRFVKAERAFDAALSDSKPLLIQSTSAARDFESTTSSESYGVKFGFQDLESYWKLLSIYIP